MNKTAPSDHPRPDELEAYGLGKLQGDEAFQVESHLSTCVDCSQTLKEQSGDSFVDMVRAAQVLEDPSASFPTANSAFAAAKAYDPGGQTEAGFLEEHGKQSKKTFQILPELVNHPRYRIQALLGQGGMGAVYLAEHKLMERRVALKTIGKDLSARPNLVQRFHLEVKAAARLSHPNIVSAYDAEQAGRTHFLVMEYVEGTDLAGLIAKRGPLPVEQACEYIRQAALGLQHAHEQGMIHRDIKPHNLMVTSAGQIKILDFGLARFAREAENQSGAVTALGAIMGTPDYMAPEQANDSHQADIRADIYSLGCTLYFLLAGCVPFPKGSFMDKMMRHTQDQPPLLTQFRSDIVPGLAEIVAKMMTKKPAGRYQTPLEVAKALEQFIPSKGIRQLPPRDPAAELFALVLATDDEIVSTSRSLGKKGNTDFGRRRRTGIGALIALVGLLALFVGGGVCLYQVIIHVETPQGMLEIRTDDENVEVKVLQGGKEVTIVDQNTGMKLSLKEGDYDLKLVSDRNDLKLSKDHIAVKRDDKVIVQVSRAIPPKSNQTAGKDPNPLEQKLAPELVYRFEWPGAHCGAVLSPDNRYCLGQSDLSTSRIWDMANGKLIAETPLIMGGTFTADAKQIVGHRFESKVFVWDVLNSKESRKWDVPEAVSDLALSPDGKQVLTSLADKSIRLYAYETGQELRKMEGAIEAGMVMFSPDGKRALSAGGQFRHQDKTIRVWDLESGKVLRTFDNFKDIEPLEGSDLILRAYFVSGGQRIAGYVWGTDKRLVIWDATSGEKIGQHDLGADFSKDLAISPGGKWFLTAHSDHTIRLRDLATGAELHRFQTPNVESRFVTFSTDGQYVVAGSWRGSVYVWRLWK